MMLYLSLGANLAIMGTLVWMILRDHPAACTIYGPDSPARRLLACGHGAIALPWRNPAVRLQLGLAARHAATPNAVL